MADTIPKWHEEIEMFCRIKSLLICEGNVLDAFKAPCDFGEHLKKGMHYPKMKEYLHDLFRYHLKYESVVLYDSLAGFYAGKNGGSLDGFPGQDGEGDAQAKTLAAPFVRTGSTRAPIRAAPELVREALTQAKTSTAVIMDFTSRYIVSPESVSQAEVDSFTILLQSVLEAKDVEADGRSTKNALIMLVNKVNDLPSWLYLQNPAAKVISITAPSKNEREAMLAGDELSRFFDEALFERGMSHYSTAEGADDLKKITDRFVALTEGFGYSEMAALRELCFNSGFEVRDLCKVIDLYKFGVRENPWDALDRERIKNAGSGFFNKRVLGQDHAVRRSLDVIKRAITGLSGMQGSSAGRPKGVLFFAGPTGVGKTETAKTLAELIFGSEGDAAHFIRFDMSEYREGHSDQKLLGAPPGYVGYDAGGQLTNALRKNPFSILLFDEIEKAHPSILDKFLQILEDGRMTDGQGNTVYFSECVIIFTSNLGITRTWTDSNGVWHRDIIVSRDNAIEEGNESVRSKVKGAIEQYFKEGLGRPELLNRIGDNIIVFDYISDDVAERILNMRLKEIEKRLSQDKGIKIELSDTAWATLLQAALENLENGGRGINNIVEAMLINPLGRYIFDNDLDTGTRTATVLKIDSIDLSSGEESYSLTCGLAG